MTALLIFIPRLISPSDRPSDYLYPKSRVLHCHSALLPLLPVVFLTSISITFPDLSFKMFSRNITSNMRICFWPLCTFLPSPQMCNRWGLAGDHAGVQVQPAVRERLHQWDQLSQRGLRQPVCHHLLCQLLHALCLPGKNWGWMLRCLVWNDLWLLLF